MLGIILCIVGALGIYLLLMAFGAVQPDAQRKQPGTLPLPEALSAAEICPDDGRRLDCWIEVANERGCYVWIEELQPGSRITWSEECSDGLGEGAGYWVEVRRTNGRVFRSREQGLLVRGLRQGPWTARNSNG